MPLPSEMLINKLWNDFQLYIQGNWSLPIEFGIKDGKIKKRILLKDFGEFVPLNNVQPQIKFCQVLCEILKHNLSQKDKAGFKVPHENTMRGFLKAGLSATTQKITLNTFAVFLGYDHWDDYRRKNSKIFNEEKNKNIFNKKVDDKVSDSKKIPLKHPVRKNKKMVALFLYAASVILITIVIFIFLPKKIYNNPIDISSVISTIFMGNKAEFDAYSKIPLIDTSSLDQFFVNTRPDGSARASIVGSLNRRKKAGCILVTSNSSYNLIDIAVKKIQDTVAYLTTTEKWHLRWYDTVIKKEVWVYDTTNEHEYILVKRDKTWKILMDDYKGKLRRPAFMESEL